MAKEFEKTLRENGYKATPARLAILSFFKEGCEPMSAEDIYKKIKNQKSKENKINFTTVYRTITSLVEGGILKKVDLRKDAMYFELHGSHHHHIVCIKCGMIEEFKNQETEKLVEKIIKNSSRFKTANEHSFEFFGLCNACA